MLLSISNYSPNPRLPCPLEHPHGPQDPSGPQNIKRNRPPSFPALSFSPPLLPLMDLALPLISPRSLGSKTARTTGSLLPGVIWPRPSWLTTPSVASVSSRPVVPFGRGGVGFVAHWARFPQANLGLPWLACSFRMLLYFRAKSIIHTEPHIR